MKRPCMSLIACAIAMFAGSAAASSGSLVEFKPQVMPVVVQVNDIGKVTDILPSRPLAPWLRKLLVEQLDAWIVKPAVVKGHAVASRFIVEVAMQTKPRNDGDYDAHFVYVKSLPLAYGGALHWDVIDGGLELALVSDDPGFSTRHYMHYFRDLPRDSVYPVRSPHPSAAAPRTAVRTPPTFTHPVVSTPQRISGVPANPARTPRVERQ